jgi:hypothetical protein
MSIKSSMYMRIKRHTIDPHMRIKHIPVDAHLFVCLLFNRTSVLLRLLVPTTVMNVVYKCLLSKSSLVNYVVRYGILHGQMDSIIGRNIFYCSSRYKTSLYNIINLHFQPCDIYSYCRAKVRSSVLLGLSPLIELLQCRDGSLCLSSSDFNNMDISSMINPLCTC